MCTFTTGREYCERVVYFLRRKIRSLYREVVKHALHQFKIRFTPSTITCFESCSKISDRSEKVKLNIVLQHVTVLSK